MNAKNILFRGKRIDNGEWITGALFPTSNGDPLICNSVINMSLVGETSMCTACAIDADTVGQSINRVDKNGREIFVGDILQGDSYPFYYEQDNVYNYYAEVCWFDDEAYFGLCAYKNPNSSVIGVNTGNTYMLNNWEPGQWEVIGNVYDNPELCGEEEEDITNGYF